MTTKDYRLDPEFAGLLREAARDPRSTLGRCLPAGSIRRLGKISEPLRSSDPDLGALDRHLLDVWRHDLAEILYSRALLEFTGGPGRGRINLYRGADLRYELPTHEQLLEREAAARESRDERLPSSESPTCGAARPSIAALLVESQRILPHPRNALLGAAAMVQAGDAVAAQASIQSLLASYQDRRTRQRGAEVLALARSRMGDAREAERLLRLAHDLEPERGHAVLSWFACAVLRGDLESTLEAGREIERIFLEGSGLLRAFSDNLRGMRSSGEVVVSREGRVGFERARDRLGAVAGRIGEVLVT